jgi:hypothetical protein
MGFKKGERIVARFTLKQAIECGYANEDGSLTQGAEGNVVKSRLWRGKEFGDPAEYEYLIKR